MISSLKALRVRIHVPNRNALALYFSTVCGNFAHVLLDLFDVGGLKAGVLEKLGKGDCKSVAVSTNISVLTRDYHYGARCIADNFLSHTTH